MTRKKSDPLPAGEGPAGEEPAAGAAPSFLEELSLLEGVGPQLAATLLEQRRRWIEQFELNTAPELMLLDQAIVGYFYVLQMGKQAGAMLRQAERADRPGQGPACRQDNQQPPQSQAPLEGGPPAPPGQHEPALALLNYVVRFNRMFLRNLWAMRGCKAHQAAPDWLKWIMNSRR